MARLAVVMGDPTGIGPEVLARALDHLVREDGTPDLLVIGDGDVWGEATRSAGAQLAARAATVPGAASSSAIPFADLRPESRAWTPGAVSPAAGRAVVLWLEHAVRLALDGNADAVVFAPLNKQAIMRAGYAVRDEYDLCATLVGAADHDEVNVIPHPAGTSPDALLWVARATSHVALRDVAGLLTLERVRRTIRLAHEVATRAGQPHPHIGVAALNPHAGEGGLVGREEIDVIRPAVDAAVAEGIAASGPHPADHIFRLARGGAMDAVVAMYHDQAQIATKLLGFDRGVSIGLGYPFVLATPSHGTAFDIVGTGTADPGPMAQALRLAVRLAGASR